MSNLTQIRKYFKLFWELFGIHFVIGYMQKDVHYYLTYALAIKAGIDTDSALVIAWANQHTDTIKDSDVYGIQTQVGVSGRWEDEQIQLSVIIPFHFIPGDHPFNEWATTANCRNARRLVDDSLAGGGLMSLGIALHTLQDTFSHANFSGWREDYNSCYPWYYLRSVIPNIGHAEMGPVPDMTDRVWVDPRTGIKINNRIVVLDAAKQTFQYLCRKNYIASYAESWNGIKEELIPILQIPNYDIRKQAIIDWVGTIPRYSGVQKSELDFKDAAALHLSRALGLIRLRY